MAKARVFAAIAMVLLASTALAEISVLESNARIKGTALEIEIMASNTGTVEKEILVKVDYLGVLNQKTENIAPETTKLLLYRVNNVKPGEIRIALIADNNRFMKINVPEDYSEKSLLLVQEIGIKEWKEGQENRLLENIQAAVNRVIGSSDVAAVMAALLAIVAVLFAVRIIVRKKTALEKQVVANEELLKEAKEIEEKRERVGGKLKL